jgi:hypothetical protein
VAGNFCENDNKSLRFIKDKEILDQDGNSLLDSQDVRSLDLLTVA